MSDQVTRLDDARVRRNAHLFGVVPMALFADERFLSLEMGPRLLLVTLLSVSMKGQFVVKGKSIRALGRLLDRSPSTVRQYARVLERQGFVRRRMRKVDAVQNLPNDWELLWKRDWSETIRCGDAPSARPSAGRVTRAVMRELGAALSEAERKLEAARVVEAMEVRTHGALRAPVDIERELARVDPDLDGVRAELTRQLTAARAAPVVAEVTAARAEVQRREEDVCQLRQALESARRLRIEKTLASLQTDEG